MNKYNAGQSVGVMRPLMLVAGVVCLLVVPFVLGVPIVSRVRAQSPPGTTSLAFEAASVRVNKTASGGGPFGPQPGGRFIATNVPLRFVIRFAYESSPWNRVLESFQVEGGPGWITADRFDINAKAASEVPLPQLRLMVQAMLADRFKLRAHYEKRELPVYRLKLSRRDGALGPQLRRTAVNCAAPQDPFRANNPTEPTPCGYFGIAPGIDPASAQANQVFRGLTMEGVASNLRSFLGRTVIDATGLGGYYDGDFEFTAEIVLPPPPPGVPNPFIGRVFPSIFSVLPQQLGLRLDADRGPVDVLVLDSVEPPTEN